MGKSCMGNLNMSAVSAPVVLSVGLDISLWKSPHPPISLDYHSWRPKVLLLGDLSCIEQFQNVHFASFGTVGENKHYMSSVPV